MILTITQPFRNVNLTPQSLKIRHWRFTVVAALMILAVLMSPWTLAAFPVIFAMAHINDPDKSTPPAAAPENPNGITDRELFSSPVAPWWVVILQRGMERWGLWQERRAGALGNGTRRKLVERLVERMERKDPVTAGHVERVSRLIEAFGERLGLSESAVQDIKDGARLHDVGKLFIWDRVLNKPGPLNDLWEWPYMRLHTLFGFLILSQHRSLRYVASIAMAHQEKWDGSGYPLHARGIHIPMAARLISIVDTFDAMTSDRPYRKALSEDEAIRELQRLAGQQWDPWLVGQFIELLKEFKLKGIPVTESEIAAEAKATAPPASPERSRGAAAPKKGGPAGIIEIQLVLIIAGILATAGIAGIYVLCLEIYRQHRRLAPPSQFHSQLTELIDRRIRHDALGERAAIRKALDHWQKKWLDPRVRSLGKKGLTQGLLLAELGNISEKLGIYLSPEQESQMNQIARDLAPELSSFEVLNTANRRINLMRAWQEKIVEEQAKLRQSAAPPAAAPGAGNEEGFVAQPFLGILSIVTGVFLIPAGLVYWGPAVAFGMVLFCVNRSPVLNELLPFHVDIAKNFPNQPTTEVFPFMKWNNRRSAVRMAEINVTSVLPDSLESYVVKNADKLGGFKRGESAQTATLSSPTNFRGFSGRFSTLRQSRMASLMRFIKVFMSFAWVWQPRNWGQLATSIWSSSSSIMTRYSRGSIAPKFTITSLHFQVSVLAPLTLIAFLIWPEHFRHILGTSAMVFMAGMTEPPPGSEPPASSADKPAAAPDDEKGPMHGNFLVTKRWDMAIQNPLAAFLVLTTTLVLNILAAPLAAYALIAIAFSVLYNPKSQPEAIESPVEPSGLRDILPPLVQPGGLGLSRIDQVNLIDDNRHRAQVVSIAQMSEIMGAKAEAGVVLALDPSQISMSQIFQLLKQLLKSNPDKKRIRVAFVGSNLALRPRARLVESMLRLQLGLKAITIDRTAKVLEPLDLDWLYGEIRRQDSTMDGFSLYLLADPSMDLKPSWRSRLIQVMMAVTKDTFILVSARVADKLRAAQAAAVSQ
ncbi:MAG: hypothetical protein A3A86_00440 [Elusimicrobia bacterium RIFCSPLOWO2_01_FULL_60_11]|nr:MAG: hypothetical protein A3A86_00440 [Elusimicrobia bacterium RIFCSPLOWO2_01_FULL_60_11]